MQKENSIVCLVHGLGCGPWIMRFLGYFIKKRKFNISFFKYASLRLSFEENVESFQSYLKKLNVETIYLVGHSLGGLVILKALENQADTRVKRIVLLGSPLQGSYYAQVLANHKVGRLLLGKNADIWTNMPNLILPSAEVGLIAGGYAPKIKIGPNIPLEIPNDGVVTVKETQMPGVTDFIIIPASHSGMLLSAEVGKAVVNFLEQGKF